MTRARLLVGGLVVLALYVTTLALFGGLFGGTEPLVRSSRRIPTAVGLLTLRGANGVEAVTIGRVVYVHPVSLNNAALLRHELEHVRQWRAAWLSYPLRYVLGLALCVCRCNGYERAAVRAVAGAPGDQGECARSRL